RAAPRHPAPAGGGGKRGRPRPGGAGSRKPRAAAAPPPLEGTQLSRLACAALSRIHRREVAAIPELPSSAAESAAPSRSGVGHPRLPMRFRLRALGIEQFLRLALCFAVLALRELRARPLHCPLGPHPPPPHPPPP